MTRVRADTGAARAGPPPIHISRVGAAHYTGPAGASEERWCRDWHLTPAQVQQFFRISQRYDNNPYAGFYQASCSIQGELEADGNIWAFTIDGGGTAEWQRPGERRFWGCSVAECGPLVILLTDSMSGE